MTAARPIAFIEQPFPRASEEMTLGQLVGNVLLEHGIEDLFCIPGDFTMQLSREFDRTSGLRLRTMSHEYGTTLAALGYAVARRVPGALCFTYGVGVLNATNAIAQAYVERVPLIVVSGGPGKREREAEIFLHHQITDHDAQYRIMREVTVHQARIQDPHVAAEQIRDALRVALEASRPVYVEIPRDLYLTKVRYVPRKPPAPPAPGRFSADAFSAARHAIELLREAARPVFVPGLELKRFRLEGPAQRIVDALGLPWVATPMSQGTLDPAHPNYRGVFAGPASPDLTTRTLVEECDLLFLVGEPNSDVNMGVAGNVPVGRLVHAYDGRVRVGRKLFAATTMEFVSALAEVAASQQAGSPRSLEAGEAPSSSERDVRDQPDSEPLTPFTVTQELDRYFAAEPDAVLIVDCGDSFFMSLSMCPADVLTSSLYMSMGIAVPGAIGYQLGSGKRPIVLVGDGAFHMTGLELMHAKRFGVSPIVIVLNNSRWTSLSTDESDHALIRQEHLEFSRFAHYINVKSFTARTGADLRRQLAEALELNEPILIDAVIDPSMRSYLCERFFHGIKQQQHLPKQ
ncbi:thiamine pyrophosphate-binding protein [Sorangium sp. So ce1504]|uniref:thiamine pyrophosphate-binding protein n=1 Tax=Sorangium sp. So ce1504 TaxID=3133337 RepID=UPI003F6364BF